MLKVHQLPQGKLDQKKIVVALELGVAKILAQKIPMRVKLRKTLSQLQ